MQTLEPTTVLCYDGAEYWQAEFVGWRAFDRAKEYADSFEALCGLLVVRGPRSIWKMKNGWVVYIKGRSSDALNSWHDAAALIQGLATTAKREQPATLRHPAIQRFFEAHGRNWSPQVIGRLERRIADYDGIGQNGLEVLLAGGDPFVTIAYNP